MFSKRERHRVLYNLRMDNEDKSRKAEIIIIVAVIITTIIGLIIT